MYSFAGWQRSLHVGCYFPRSSFLSRVDAHDRGRPDLGPQCVGDFADLIRDAHLGQNAQVMPCYVWAVNAGSKSLMASGMESQPLSNSGEHPARNVQVESRRSLV